MLAQVVTTVNMGVTSEFIVGAAWVDVSPVDAGYGNGYAVIVNTGTEDALWRLKATTPGFYRFTLPAGAAIVLNLLELQDAVGGYGVPGFLSLYSENGTTAKVAFFC
jgi:hypothetical protein